MEKVNSRNSSAKGNSSDPKTKQDVANKHLRLPRVKESVSPRPEARQKPNPQRNREMFDKRPRLRAGAVCERYRSEINDHAVGESHKQGSKKMNLNHLLNFTMASSESREANTTRRANYNRIKLPKYNKELFLQANCQFVARVDGNYTVHEKNPDILVEWPLIEEIRLPSYEVPLCPICLYSPIAAKITRCGHIYCWPCILHYLALTDRTWQKCPICFEAVHKNELKSVSLRIQVSACVGDEITMCLMKRVKGSLLTTPITHESPKQVCNVNTDDYVARFQKLLLASKKDIYSIISREQSELEAAYEREKNTPEACFIESALKLLEEREKNISSLPELITEENEQFLYDAVVTGKTFQRNHNESISSTESHEEIFSFESNEPNSNLQVSDNAALKISCNSFQEVPHDSEKKGISYFYQAEDGQHIYLHNINVRMLLKEHGSLENAPPIIKAKIVEIDSVSMTENLRKRLRYLQHLPLTCEFQVVELDFLHLVEKETLHQFESEINKRRYFRNRKARDERRREKFIEMEENKKLGKFPKATYNLQSVDQFPSYQPDDFLPLSPPKNTSGNENISYSNNLESNSYREENNLSPTNCNSYQDAVDYVPTTSFAQMLKDGPKTFNQTPIGKKQVTDIQPPVSMNQDSDDENWTHRPENQSLSDVLAMALSAVNLQDSSAGGGQKSSKKKRGKKQLLFTTSMCRKN